MYDLNARRKFVNTNSIGSLGERYVVSVLIGGSNYNVLYFLDIGNGIGKGSVAVISAVQRGTVHGCRRSGAVGITGAQRNGNVGFAAPVYGRLGRVRHSVTVAHGQVHGKRVDLPGCDKRIGCFIRAVGVGAFNERTVRNARSVPPCEGIAFS